MKKIPLHFQILIALIVGTILGLIFNPGEISLEDQTLTLTPVAGGFEVVQKNSRTGSTGV